MRVPAGYESNPAYAELAKQQDPVITPKGRNTPTQAKAREHEQQLPATVKPDEVAEEATPEE